jgi:hypothetical protein
MLDSSPSIPKIPHNPEFFIAQCSDARVRWLLKRIFIDKIPGLYLKYINPGPFVAPYWLHVLLQRPCAFSAGALLQALIVIWSCFAGKYISTEKLIYRAYPLLGWLKNASPYAALRLGIKLGARKAIVVSHQDCGAHNDNLGPGGRALAGELARHNAVYVMEALKRTVSAETGVTFYVWFVNFAGKCIELYDPAARTWSPMSRQAIEDIIGSELPREVADLFDELLAANVASHEHCVGH